MDVAATVWASCGKGKGTLRLAANAIIGYQELAPWHFPWQHLRQDMPASAESIEHCGSNSDFVQLQAILRVIPIGTITARRKEYLHQDVSEEGARKGSQTNNIVTEHLDGQCVVLWLHYGHAARFNVVIASCMRANCQFEQTHGHGKCSSPLLRHGNEAFRVPCASKKTIPKKMLVSCGFCMLKAQMSVWWLGTAGDSDVLFQAMIARPCLV